MKGVRVVLLALSCIVVLLLAGGAVALKVGNPDGSYKEVVLFSEVLALIMDHYVDPVDADQMLEGAYESMLTSLDAHGAFLTAAEVAAWGSGEDGSLADPGLSLIKLHSSLEVVYVGPDSPAATAGIEIGDQIRKIGERASRALSLDQAMQALRGARGTAVSVEVLRPTSNFERWLVDLPRAHREFPAYSIERDEDVVVLTVFDLPRIDAAQLSTELEAAEERGIARLMVDLRNVTEGDPRQAIPFAGLFVGGPMLRLKDRSGASMELLESSADPAWSGEIGVLVNGASLGAAEAIAALLQAADATVYGERTFGLGTEPKLFPLPDGSAVVMSAAVWETAAGDRWNESGLEPDLEIPRTGMGSEAAAEQRKRALDAFRGLEDPAVTNQAA